MVEVERADLDYGAWHGNIHVWIVKEWNIILATDIPNLLFHAKTSSNSLFDCSYWPKSDLFVLLQY